MQEILGAFHGKIKQITEHQYSVLKRLREQIESMRTKVGSMEGKLETVTDVNNPDSDMVRSAEGRPVGAAPAVRYRGVWARVQATHVMEA